MKNIKQAFILCLVLSFSVFSFESGKSETTNRCAMPNFNSAFQNSKAVFVGKVVRVSEKGGTKTFEFEVEKYWKGASAKKIKVNVGESPRFQAWFKQSRRYLIYARGEQDGTFWDARCSASKEIADAAEDLKKLGKGKRPS